MFYRLNLLATGQIWGCDLALNSPINGHRIYWITASSVKTRLKSDFFVMFLHVSKLAEFIKQIQASRPAVGASRFT